MNHVSLKDVVLARLVKENIKESLRAELYQEILKEVNAPSPWSEVHAYIDELLIDYDNWDASRVRHAITTVIRYSFGLQKLGLLQRDQVPRAKMIADSVAELIAPPEVVSANRKVARRPT